MDIKRRAVENATQSLELENVLLMDGLDSAIAGIGGQYGKPTLVIYDEALIIKELIEGHEMSIDDAWEYYYINIKHAYYGEGTPIIMESIDSLEEQYGFNNADELLAHTDTA